MPPANAHTTPTTAPSDWATTPAHTPQVIVPGRRPAAATVQPTPANTPSAHAVTPQVITANGPVAITSGPGAGLPDPRPPVFADFAAYKTWGQKRDTYLLTTPEERATVYYGSRIEQRSDDGISINCEWFVRAKIYKLLGESIGTDKFPNLAGWPALHEEPYTNQGITWQIEVLDYRGDALPMKGFTKTVDGLSGEARLRAALGSPAPTDSLLLIFNGHAVFIDQIAENGDVFFSDNRRATYAWSQTYAGDMLYKYAPSGKAYTMDDLPQQAKLYQLPQSGSSYGNSNNYGNKNLKMVVLFRRLP